MAKWEINPKYMIQSFNESTGQVTFSENNYDEDEVYTVTYTDDNGCQGSTQVILPAKKGTGYVLWDIDSRGYFFALTEGFNDTSPIVAIGGLCLNSAYGDSSDCCRNFDDKCSDPDYGYRNPLYTPKYTGEKYVIDEAFYKEYGALVFEGEEQYKYDSTSTNGSKHMLLVATDTKQIMPSSIEDRPFDFTNGMLYNMTTMHYFGFADKIPSYHRVYPYVAFDWRFNLKYKLPTDWNGKAHNLPVDRQVEYNINTNSYARVGDGGKNFSYDYGNTGTYIYMWFKGNGLPNVEFQLTSMILQGNDLVLTSNIEFFEPLTGMTIYNEAVEKNSDETNSSYGRVSSKDAIEFMIYGTFAVREKSGLEGYYSLPSEDDSVIPFAINIFLHMGNLRTKGTFGSGDVAYSILENEECNYTTDCLYQKLRNDNFNGTCSC